MSKISIAITNYNRSKFLIDSFIDVIDNDNIDDILICDDYSDISIFDELLCLVGDLNNSKVSVIRNDRNVKPFLNKYNAVKNCKNEWVIILDSDNKISNDYVNRVSSIPVIDKIAYLPQIIHRENLINIDKPELWDFHTISDIEIDSENIFDILSGGKPTNERSSLRNTSSDVVLNQGNFFVNRLQYMNTIESSSNIDYKIADTGLDGMYFFFLWLKNNNSIKVVPGLEYNHRIHDGSWYLNNSENSLYHSAYLIQKIKEL